MKCSCNGKCRVKPYVCPAGYWGRAYDPDYGRNMERFSVSVKDITDTYKRSGNISTVTSVVKD